MTGRIPIIVFLNFNSQLFFDILLHRNKREEHKVIAPASGQRRRRLFKEDLHGKVKTRKEGGAPGECVPLPGFLNYFFTHLINCMFGFLVVWSTNAALSGCLVRGQLV